MATIDERRKADGTVTYRVRVRIGGETRIKSFHRKTDARAWARDIEADLGRGRYVPDAEAERRTVGQMIDRYLDEHLPTKRKNRDERNVRRELAWWKKQIGGKQLVRCDRDLVVRQRTALQLEELKGGGRRTPATVNRYLAALSHVFSVARDEWGWVKVNPVRRVKLPEPGGRVRVLSDAERKRLLAACKKHKNAYVELVVVLALSTAARRGELLSLRWSDVDLARGVLVLRDTKNRDTRTVALRGRALELMKAHAKVRRIESDLVFPGRRPTQPTTLHTPWREVVATAEIEDFRFHDLRHTAASHLAMSGATLAELAEILGHRTLQMVKRYSHLTDEHSAEVVGRMNEKLFP